MSRLTKKLRAIEHVQQQLNEAKNNLKMSCSTHKNVYWSGQVNLYAQELMRLEDSGEDPEISVEVASNSTELTGGRVNYYLASITNPQRETQPAYTAECEDIIQALGMTFDEGCLFKALWRTAAGRLGNGKPGQKSVYDAEKMVHYANRILTKAKREAD